VINFYKVKGGLIKVIFAYSYGRPQWKIKTCLTKRKISKTKVRDPVYKGGILKGGLYLINTSSGLVLDNSGKPVKGHGRLICIFYR